VSAKSRSLVVQGTTVGVTRREEQSRELNCGEFAAIKRQAEMQRLLGAVLA